MLSTFSLLSFKRPHVTFHDINPLHRLTTKHPATTRPFNIRITTHSQKPQQALSRPFALTTLYLFHQTNPTTTTTHGHPSTHLYNPTLILFPPLTSPSEHRTKRVSVLSLYPAAAVVLLAGMMMIRRYFWCEDALDYPTAP
jgi:hypothetical protein